MTDIAAQATRVASLESRIILACALVILGSVLAFDIKGMSARFHRDSSGFTPWGQNRQPGRLPNPFRLVGVFFLLAGIATLISAALRP